MRERVPAAAWALAWLCLTGQVVELAVRGLSHAGSVSILVSVLLSALVVAWVSAGVLMARPVRFWLAAILFGLVVLLGVGSVVVALPHPDLGDLVRLAFWVAQLLALIAFGRTPYFRARRADRARPASDIAGPVLVAVVVGVLGGLTAPSAGQDSPNDIHVRL